MAISNLDRGPVYAYAGAWLALFPNGNVVLKDTFVVALLSHSGKVRVWVAPVSVDRAATSDPSRLHMYGWRGTADGEASCVYCYDGQLSPPISGNGITLYFVHDPNFEPHYDLFRFCATEQEKDAEIDRLWRLGFVPCGEFQSPFGSGPFVTDSEIGQCLGMAHHAIAKERGMLPKKPEKQGTWRDRPPMI